MSSRCSANAPGGESTLLRSGDTSGLLPNSTTQSSTLPRAFTDSFYRRQDKATSPSGQRSPPAGSRCGAKPGNFPILWFGNSPPQDPCQETSRRLTSPKAQTFRPLSSHPSADKADLLDRLDPLDRNIGADMRRYVVLAAVTDGEHLPEGRSVHLRAYRRLGTYCSRAITGCRCCADYPFACLNPGYSAGICASTAAGNRPPPGHALREAGCQGARWSCQPSVRTYRRSQGRNSPAMSGREQASSTVARI